MKNKTKGTMILCNKGSVYKVMKVRSRGDNNWAFECNNLDTKESQTLTLKISSFLEALDKAPHLKIQKRL